MPINVHCDNCGHRFRAREEHAGKTAQCPKCGEGIVIPDGSVDEPDGFEIVTMEEPSGGRVPVLPPPVTSRSPRAVGQGGWFGGVDTGLLGLGRRSGLLCLVVGFVFAVTARGCDSLANRSVASAAVRYDKVKREFADEWEDKRADLQEEVDEAREKMDEMQKTINDLPFNDPKREGAQENIKAAREKMEEAQKKIDESQREEQKERRRRERDDWKDLQRRARDAQTSNVTGQYWRDLLFVIGSVALVVGLLTVGFAGESHERLICLIMIAIITFSLYVGGLAWMDSVVSAARSAAGFGRPPF